MPRPHAYNPLLKSYPDSEKINAVSEGAETLYTRLLAICDDNACFWGDPKLVLVKAYSQRWANGELSEQDVCTRMEELRCEGLITFYRHDDKPYLQVLNCFKTLRKDVKRVCLFPEPPAPATAVHIQEAAGGQEEPQEGTETLLQTEQEGDGSGTDAGRARPGPGPNTAAQKRPDQTRPEGEAPSLRSLVREMCLWKGRDTSSNGTLTMRDLLRIQRAVDKTKKEFNVPSWEAERLLLRACSLLMERERSPVWTNIDYALGCVRSRARELRDGGAVHRIKRKPDEIREDIRRQQANAEHEARQLKIQETLAKRTAISMWILSTPEEELGHIRDEAVARSRLSPGLLCNGDHTKSGVLRELMFDIAHEAKPTK